MINRKFFEVLNSGRTEDAPDIIVQRIHFFEVVFQLVGK